MGLKSYGPAFKLAITFCLLLGYIFKTCKLYHDNHKTKNKLSYVPFGLIIAFLFINISGMISIGFKKTQLDTHE